MGRFPRFEPLPDRHQAERLHGIHPMTLWKIAHAGTVRAIKSGTSGPFRAEHVACVGITRLNGICERFHRTVQKEFHSTAFRKNLYRRLEELQGDLDDWTAVGLAGFQTLGSREYGSDSYYFLGRSGKAHGEGAKPC
jgi:hypothetical protein